MASGAQILPDGVVSNRQLRVDELNIDQVDDLVQLPSSISTNSLIGL
jgi:hypothetical protein